MLCRGLAILAIMSNTARTASASGASAAKKARTASASEASTQERYSRLMMLGKESFVSRTGMAKLMRAVDSDGLPEAYSKTTQIRAIELLAQTAPWHWAWFSESQGNYMPTSLP